MLSVGLVRAAVTTAKPAVAMGLLKHYHPPFPDGETEALSEDVAQAQGHTEIGAGNGTQECLLTVL